MSDYNSTSIFRRVFRLLKLDKKEIGQIYGFAILIGVVNLSLPLGIQSIINFIQAGQFSTSWVVLITLVIVATAFVGIMQAFQLRITENIQQKIFTRASFDFAYRIPRFKLDQLSDKYAPELINRFFDTITLQKGISKLLIDISTSTLQIIFALILLSLYHPFFILFSFSLIFVLYLIFKLSGKKGLETSLNESKYKYKVVYWLEEIARNINTFKLAGNTNLHITKTDDIVDGYLKQRESHFKVLIFQYLNLVGFKVFVIAGLLIVGGILVIDQQINLGQFIASEIIIILIMNNVEKLIIGLETIYDVLTSVEKIGQITDLELENNNCLTKNELSMEVLDLEFKNVDFTYPNSDIPVLKNISFDLKNKEKICVSGFNESGKTTLLHLIYGAYSPNNGNLFFNDLAISNIDLIKLRDQIGGCLSSEYLFNGTIIENISLGKPKVSFEQVKKAIEKAGLKEFIKMLPNGYNTLILPEGDGLAKSTIKKILLARAIVDEPKLLLFENFFEYFDHTSKKEFIHLLCDKNSPWGLITISNDAEVAKACNKVIVLKNGEIITQGSFEEVIKNQEIKSLYYA